MKKIIIAKDLTHLERLVKKEVGDNGYECSLNHIDVSQVTDMSALFADKKFNGDISKWDTSNVTRMTNMFIGAAFNGDISKWNVSKVKEMGSMFNESKFNGDLSEWDVSNVVNMYAIFASSDFCGDLTNWKPYALKNMRMTYLEQLPNAPYWVNFEDDVLRVNAINSYWLKKELDKDLINNNIEVKKIKL